MRTRSQIQQDQLQQEQQDSDTEMTTPTTSVTFAYTAFTTVNVIIVCNALFSMMDDLSIDTAVGYTWYKRFKNDNALTQAQYTVLYSRQFPDPFDDTLTEAQATRRDKILKDSKKSLGVLKNLVQTLLTEADRTSILQRFQPNAGQYKSFSNVSMGDIFEWIKDNYVTSEGEQSALITLYSTQPFKMLASKATAAEEIRAITEEFTTVFDKLASNLSDDTKMEKMRNAIIAKLLLSPVNFRNKVNELRVGVDTYNGYKNAIIAAHNFFKTQDDVPDVIPVAAANAASGRQRSPLASQQIIIDRIDFKLHDPMKCCLFHGANVAHNTTTCARLRYFSEQLGDDLCKEFHAMFRRQLPDRSRSKSPNNFKSNWRTRSRSPVQQRSRSRSPGRSTTPPPRPPPKARANEVTDDFGDAYDCDLDAAAFGAYVDSESESDDEA